VEGDATLLTFAADDLIVVDKLNESDGWYALVLWLTARGCGCSEHHRPVHLRAIGGYLRSRGHVGDREGLFPTAFVDPHFVQLENYECVEGGSSIA
jgi:hypothetical protein